MEKTGITVHSIVRNEDHFVWFAIMSVLPYVDRIMVYDTGSTDKTVDVIKAISSPKIVLTEKGKAPAEKLVRLRQEMVAATTTPFFLILDGDEVWPEKEISIMLAAAKTMPKDKLALVCRTRNCVGDVWHYLPQNAGNYSLAGQRGHLSMRLFRTSSQLSVSGEYPLEAFLYQGVALNDQPDRLLFVDAHYWHLTHLSRSSQSDSVLGFRQKTIEKGILAKQADMPEIFWHKRPNDVPDPLVKRGLGFEIGAQFVSPVKELKRRLFRG